ncbi:MAG TPA: hypothetical protein DEP28_06140 [Bacteroidetes bacterium]|nr:hypothetical protein [Bacteroidota bacterium]
MKKFKFIILIICLISMSFTFRGSCSGAIGGFLLYMDEFLWKPFFDKGDGLYVANGISIGRNGQIYRTTGNDTINLLPKNSGTTQDLNAIAISYHSEPFYLVVGNNGTILRSVNEGNNWMTRTSPTTNNLNDVCFGFNGYQYIVGDAGTLLRSNSLGQNWSTVSSGTTRKLNVVTAHSAQTEIIIVAGEKGTILRSSTSGFTFTNVSIPDTTFDFTCNNLSSVGNVEINNFYLAGTNGKIYRSTNFGLNWTALNSGITTNINSIFFESDDSGAVAGDNGVIRVTTNSGLTWNSDPIFNGLSGNLTSISVMPRASKTYTALSLNGMTGLSRIGVISEDSVIIVTSVKQLSSEIPSTFKLHQNYPNPFNPKTKIKFDIEKSTNVKLSIFDITGKEVALLVNTFLPLGEYEADWDAGNFASGVYFYRLYLEESKGNATVLTNKMILSK